MNEQQPNSLISLAQQTLENQRQEALRRQEEGHRLDLANKFTEVADVLIWKYGPVKTKRYNSSYVYAYIESGVHRLPIAKFDTSEGPIDVTIEGKYENTVLIHSHPAAMDIKRLALIMAKGNNATSIAVNCLPPDKETRTQNPELETLPSNEDLELAIIMMNHIASEYERLGIKKAPTDWVDPLSN